MIAKHSMLGANARWTGTGGFGGSDISSRGVVGSGVLQESHALPAVVGYFVFDAVPAGGGSGARGP